MLRALCLVGFISVLAGCGGPSLRSEPTDISGKLSFADGTPIGGVNVNLQPMQNTLPGVAKTKADGSFTVKIAPGKYTVFISKVESATPEETATFGKVPELYRSANKDFTFDVKAGAPLDVKLPQ